ncbi:MAG: hypothetical protein FD139_2152 [Methylocystaceae bacterium]|nr:MAG: hypothetical protein FD172_308 [Methylocystaceae bacterium]TXT44542.1 MAG: hypothetical protein FD139_2152 [Methylocystaceae bacterium]
MIEQLHLKNFKCFADQALRIANFTLLAGLNGTGKSTVIQSLLLLRQSFRSGALSEGHFLFGGDLVDLGTPTDVLYERASDDEISISLRMQGVESAALFKATVTQDRKNALLNPSDARGAANTVLLDQHSALLSGEALQPLFSMFHYLHAERNGPRKFLPMARGQTDSDLGVRGEYVLDALDRCQDAIKISSSDPRAIDGAGERLRDQLEAWLQIISPGVRLSISPIPDADLMISGFSFGASGQLRSRNYRASNVGFGLSYVLPIIVALLGTAPGGLILIENPEAHIHPKGQTKLGELCVRAAAAGIQVVVETHSDHVMDGARIAVREKILNSDRVVFHYFDRGLGETSVLTPVLDNAGRLSEWPPGFFDQHRRNTSRLVKPLDRG